MHLGKPDWNTVALIAEDTHCSDPRDRVFGVLGMLSTHFRFFPDYSMQAQDILLNLITRQAEEMDINAISEDSWIWSVEHMNTFAARWFLILNDTRDQIKASSVRCHLFGLLYESYKKSSELPCEAWHFKVHLWFQIPDERSWTWRLVRATANLLRGVKNRIGRHMYSFQQDEINPDLSNVFADSDSDWHLRHHRSNLQ